MRTRNSLLALALLPGCARPPARAPVAAQIVAQEQQLARAFHFNDAAAVQNLSTDDFQGTNDRGVRYGKSTLVAAVADIAKAGIRVTSSVTDVQDVGTVAVAHGYDHYRNADGTHPRDSIWTDIWILRNGQWKVVAAQDGPVLR